MALEIRSKDIRLIPTSEIKPNPGNKNKHTDEQIDRLCKIIEYQGFRSPLIVSNQSGLLVSGHGRLMAAKKLGLASLPVTYQDFETPAQEFAAMVSENAIASWAELDLPGITADLPELGIDFDIALLGINGFVPCPAEKYDFSIDEKEVDSEINTENQCPSCGHRW